LRTEQKRAQAKKGLVKMMKSNLDFSSQQNHFFLVFMRKIILFGKPLQGAPAQRYCCTKPKELHNYNNAIKVCRCGVPICVLYRSR
jgi:hypothetical protein